jgi:hypothetical protein
MHGWQGLFLSHLIFRRLHSLHDLLTLCEFLMPWSIADNNPPDFAYGFVSMS